MRWKEIWPRLLNDDGFKQLIEKDYLECGVSQLSREEVLLMGKNVLEDFKFKTS